MGKTTYIRISLLAMAAMGAVALLGLSGDAGTRQAEQTIASGEWRTRTQLLLNPQTGAMERRQLRAFDPEPKRNLDFYYEPAAGERIGADGALSGRGTLTWRIRGAASYDEHAVYSRYEGELANGRPDGRGKLVMRSGERYEGEFRAGLYHGQGVLHAASGDIYEGRLAFGLPNGDGRYAHASGEIETGRFSAGKPVSATRVEAAGKTAAAPVAATAENDALLLAQWNDGANPFGGSPFGSKPAQPMVGDVQISVVTDQARYQKRKAEAPFPEELYYSHKIGEREIVIVPDKKNAFDQWQNNGWMDDYKNWTQDVSYIVPVYLQLALDNKGSENEIAGIDLQFDDAATDMRPFMRYATLNGLVDCSEIPPGPLEDKVVFFNGGWGDAQNVSISFGFHKGKRGTLKSLPSKKGLGTIVSDKTLDVRFEEVLRQNGVDVAALKGFNKICASYDEMPKCMAEALKGLNFGRLPYYTSGGAILTNLEGVMDYSFRDAKGKLQTGKTRFHIPLLLGFIRLQSPAECGGGGPEDPQADIPIFDLRLDKGGYRQPYPLRNRISLGSKKRLLSFGLKSSRAAEALFKVLVRFADGSEKTSKPIRVRLMKPRQPEYSEFSEN